MMLIRPLSSDLRQENLVQVEEQIKIPRKTQNRKVVGRNPSDYPYSEWYSLTCRAQIHVKLILDETRLKEEFNYTNYRSIGLETKKL